jgi:cell division septum initiation protein DivIVA
MEQVDILRLLDDLKTMSVDEPRGFLGLTWGLDRDRITMHIAKIRASLPQELKQAAQTVRESERIVDSAREDATLTLENARKEAERILQEARREAEQIIEHAKSQQAVMVTESEILKLAKAQSEEVRASADRDALQMRRGAEAYARDVLHQLEGVVGRVMQAIDRGKSELDRAEATQSLPGRDRTRV